MSQRPASPFGVLTMSGHAWREPLDVAAGLEGAAGRLCLLSDGGPRARWSYVCAEPAEVARLAAGTPEPFRRLRAMLGPQVATPEDAPPFTGGVVGLAAYDLSTPEGERGPDSQAWPGLTLARHQAVLAFDHHRRRVTALGRGPDGATALDAADRAASWLERARSADAVAGALAARFEAERPGEAYRAAVADVTARIAAGEIFQANIARAWSGELTPGVRPFDLFARLAGQSPAPHAAFWDMGEHVLVSNSPETFVTVRGGRVTARPIKGTRPRSTDPAQDESLKAELLASAKDRAENLMIVDLMRNDLSRVCVPGSIAAPDLFSVESYPNVHHLVSTVQGRLVPGAGAAELMAASFPPGSITGAPKHQAMKVIAAHEAGRGPWCGSLFLAGFDGTLDASVLIRTVALRHGPDGRWGFRTLAGAGIVADSEPSAELAETGAKIAAIRRALTDTVPLP